MATSPPRETTPRALARGDHDYPSGLLALADSPARLFVRGERLPPLDRAVAIVGARAATGYGSRLASRLAGDLAALGFTVVSGLARGIDAAAHRGALNSSGRTVAVLPGSVEEVTPLHHRTLAEEIVARGALVSEHDRGTPVFRGSFITRNRLIAALAGATVVVEAGQTSGALSTAAAASRLGRPLLAVPGDVDRPTSRGCHALLRHGALLCEDAGDVIAALAAARATTQPAPSSARRAGRPATASAPALPLTETAGSDSTEQRLIGALGSEPRTADQLASAAEISVPETLAALLALEWAGVAVRMPGPRWARPAR